MSRARNKGGRRAPLQRLLPLYTALVLCVLAARAPGLERGDPAPVLDAPRLDGAGNLSLAAERGNVVLVDFWASWCAPCRTAMPEIESLRREFADRDFRVIAVNVDRDPRHAQKALERTPVGYASASDPNGRLPASFGLETMPTSYVVGRDGRIHYVHEGFREGDGAALRTAIRAALSEDAP